jgi:hypothetical protein
MSGRHRDFASQTDDVEFERTVIMTSVNEAWAAPGSLLDSFLESFRVGENISHFVQHIVVVAMDGGAFRRCTRTATSSVCRRRGWTSPAPRAT